MLIPDNIHPEQTVYYNGAFVLKAIQEYRMMDIIDLYIQTKSLKDMSMPVFLLCIDWLYLLEMITLDTQGQVILCS
jgi:hypothetical protein